MANYLLLPTTLLALPLYANVGGDYPAVPRLYSASVRWDDVPEAPWPFHQEHREHPHIAVGSYDGMTPSVFLPNRRSGEPGMTTEEALPFVAPVLVPERPSTDSVRAADAALVERVRLVLRQRLR